MFSTGQYIRIFHTEKTKHPVQPLTVEKGSQTLCTSAVVMSRAIFDVICCTRFATLFTPNFRLLAFDNTLSHRSFSSISGHFMPLSLYFSSITVNHSWPARSRPASAHTNSSSKSCAHWCFDSARRASSTSRSLDLGLINMTPTEQNKCEKSRREILGVLIHHFSALHMHSA